jgi:hypothetical protein
LDQKKNKKKEREQFDDLDGCLVQAAQHQSERDYPRMSIQNGMEQKCVAENVLVIVLSFFVY